MSRLTYSENGEWGLKGYDIKQMPSTIYAALYKLKDYENICDSPQRMEDLDRMYLEKCEEVNRLQEELKRYKPAEPLSRSNKYEVTREVTVKILSIGKIRKLECLMPKEKAEKMIVQVLKRCDETIAHVTVEDIKDFILEIQSEGD